jgi:large subunit ribosomal protein L3
LFLKEDRLISAVLGYKIGSTQYFTTEGKRIPVTHIQAGPCWVVAVRTVGTHQSIQIGIGTTKHMTKPIEGHIKKAGLKTKPRFLREIRLSDVGTEPSEAPSPGTEIRASDVFAVGDGVRVTGVSKGKGFAGVVKRHGFAGGPRTHGQSDRERAPGSIGQTTTPGRVYRGKRMAGRMGGDKVTVLGLQVVGIDTQKNILTVKGLVPGAPRGLLLIQKDRR